MIDQKNFPILTKILAASDRADVVDHWHRTFYYNDDVKNIMEVYLNELPDIIRQEAQKAMELYSALQGSLHKYARDGKPDYDGFNQAQMEDAQKLAEKASNDHDMLTKAADKARDQVRDILKGMNTLPAPEVT